MREFPRLLYRGDGSRFNRLIVADEHACTAALREGWREAKFQAAESIEDVIVDVPPKKRGRPRKER